MSSLSRAAATRWSRRAVRSTKEASEARLCRQPREQDARSQRRRIRRSVLGVVKPPGTPGSPGSHETRVLVSKCREANVGHHASLARGESRASSPKQATRRLLTRRAVEPRRTGARSFGSVSIDPGSGCKSTAHRPKAPIGGRVVPISRGLPAGVDDTAEGASGSCACVAFTGAQGGGSRHARRKLSAGWSRWDGARGALAQASEASEVGRVRHFGLHQPSNAAQGVHRRVAQARTDRARVGRSGCR